MRSYPLPRRLISLTLALLVLAASIGLPVQRRTCRLSGRSTVRIAWWQVAATDKPTQSPQNRSSPTLAGSCYAYSLELHHLRVPAPAGSAQKLLPAPPGPLALPPLAFALAQPACGRSLLAGTTAPRAFPTPPPRPSGRALLVRVGLLVV